MSADGKNRLQSLSAFAAGSVDFALAGFASATLATGAAAGVQNAFGPDLAIGTEADGGSFFWVAAYSQGTVSVRPTEGKNFLQSIFWATAGSVFFVSVLTGSMTLAASAVFLVSVIVTG
jgi:hypothetical protein